MQNGSSVPLILFGARKQRFVGLICDEDRYDRQDDRAAANVTILNFFGSLGSLVENFTLVAHF